MSSPQDANTSSSGTASGCPFHHGANAGAAANQAKPEEKKIEQTLQEGLYYHDYLGLDKVLSAQNMESTRLGTPAHDEHLFIVIHQVRLLFPLCRFFFFCFFVFLFCCAWKITICAKQKNTCHQKINGCGVNQAYELWFKQILHEVGSVIDIFSSDFVSHKNLAIAVGRLHRVTVIQRFVFGRFQKFLYFLLSLACFSLFILVSQK
jgi:hypothetical protein